MIDRVLIVDDDETISRLLSDMTSTEVSEVVLAKSGLEAIEKLSEKPFGLVFLDLRMPGGDGYSVIDHLARQPQAVRPTVLVLSAVADDNTRLDESVVTAVIRKPFDPHHIRAIVRRLISRSGDPGA